MKTVKLDKKALKGLMSLNSVLTLRQSAFTVSNLYSVHICDTSLIYKISDDHCSVLSSTLSLA